MPWLISSCGCRNTSPQIAKTWARQDPHLPASPVDHSSVSGGNGCIGRTTSLLTFFGNVFASRNYVPRVSGSFCNYAINKVEVKKINIRGRNSICAWYGQNVTANTFPVISCLREGQTHVTPIIMLISREQIERQIEANEYQRRQNKQITKHYRTCNKEKRKRNTTYFANTKTYRSTKKRKTHQRYDKQSSTLHRAKAKHVNKRQASAREQTKTKGRKCNRLKSVTRDDLRILWYEPRRHPRELKTPRQTPRCEHSKHTSKGQGIK